MYKMLLVQEYMLTTKVDFSLLVPWLPGLVIKMLEKWAWQYCGVKGWVGADVVTSR